MPENEWGNDDGTIDWRLWDDDDVSHADLHTPGESWVVDSPMPEPKE